MKSKANSSFLDLFFENVRSNNKSYRQISNEKELAEYLTMYLPVINSNKLIANLFLIDTDEFLNDLGIELSKELREHLEKNVSIHKYKDSKLYNQIKNGKKINGFKYLKLKPSKELIQKNITKDKIHRIYKENNEGTVKTTVSPKYIYSNFIIPTPPASNRGWTVVLQIAESYFSDLFEKIIETQYNGALLAALLTGENEFEGIAEPWHTSEFWLLFDMRVDLKIKYLEKDNSPMLTAEGCGERRLKAKFEIEGAWRSRGEGDSVPYNFVGVAEQEGSIIKRETQRDYILDFSTHFPTIKLEGENDELMEIFVAFAFAYYIREEFPILPLFTIPDTPPFIFFSNSDLSSVDYINNMNALTWTYGSGPNRITPFDRYIIKPNNNFTYGTAASAIHFSIREGLPSLPLTSQEEPDLTIYSIDVELRYGFIEVTGTGIYRTCWCYPDVDFSYTIKIYLSIDNNGNLIGNAESDVDLSGWIYFLNALLLGALGIILGPAGLIAGAGLGLIGTAIAEAMFGSLAASNLGDNLNMDMNVQEQLNDGLSGIAQATAGWISVTSKVKSVEINPSGIYFHGNLSTDAVLA